ncbi:MAG TPA: transmembrane sensor domain-containing protein, partial [Cyanobacteria bacterium UBA9273]|nr:transmembrane sensor domain-containing protein [Cyanobacteria bacterium UBA9273]
MGKLIVLKLDGNFEQGFRVTLEIGAEGDRPETEIVGWLPPAIDLVEQYQEWQSAYRSLGKAVRDIKPKRARIDGSFNKGKQECRTLANELRDRLNCWLKTESFLSIREKWLSKVSTSDPLRVMIRAENQQIFLLPWHQWDLLELYNHAEIGLSSLEYERSPTVPTSGRDRVRILAILGNQEGIEIAADRKHLENLRGAKTKFLVEPQRQELNDQLWEQPWDILFFAGHSKTEGEKGRIYINQKDSFTLDELKYALKKAVTGGLQLAIFNSCDGLGLAQELESLHIPQMIIMREPVPDRVAEAFLQYFLATFARGKSLYGAVQEARQRLQGLEDNFPCASWLPVIWQNPGSLPLQWSHLPEPKKKIHSEQQQPLLWHLWRGFQPVFVTSLAVSGLIMGGRWLGLLQAWELESYDQLLRQRPAELADSRLLLVKANEAEVRKYKNLIPDAILAQVIAKLEQYQPVAIGLDIFRDQPVPPGYDLLVAQLKQNQRLVTVCTLGDTEKEPIAPPPKESEQEIGFSDLENDPPDYTVRRHLQSRTDKGIATLSPCNTPYSFSLQLASRYLEAKKISIKTTPEKNWQFGNVVFKRLEPRSGGYQNLDARGNQVLINYRTRAHRPIAQPVTIDQILTGQFNPNWVRNRLVLIGVTAPSIQDEHDTPYGKMRGLEVHAHMVSQILSAVEDKRPLIWWLPQWADAFWVWMWSLGSGLLVGQVRSQTVNKQKLPLRLILTLSSCVAVLYGLCWVIFLQGGWLPLVPAALALIATGGVMGIGMRDE